MNDKIEKTLKEQLSRFSWQKNLGSIDLNDKLCSDLKIYGDDTEELIRNLSKEMGFDEYKFWRLFQNSGYYNPPEVSLSLPKIFFLDIEQLFKGKGKDIKVGELADLIDGLTGK